MTTSATIRELRDLIEGCEGYRLRSRIDLLGTTYYIFNGNFGDLVRALDRLHDPSVAIALWNVERREDLDRELHEVTRLFHNFLASAKTLVDHTRILINEIYSGHPFSLEYGERTNRDFANSPLARFVQELRNFILHRGIPITAADLDYTAGETLRHSIQLDLEGLRSWDRWSQQASAYLEQVGRRAILRDLVGSYATVVQQFYAWLEARQREMHADSFRELASYQRQLGELLGSILPVRQR